MGLIRLLHTLFTIPGRPRGVAMFLVGGFLLFRFCFSFASLVPRHYLSVSQRLSAATGANRLFVNRENRRQLPTSSQVTSRDSPPLILRHPNAESITAL